MNVPKSKGFLILKINNMELYNIKNDYFYILKLLNI